MKELGERLKVYVAGPYAQGDPVLNVRRAVLAGEEIVSLGHLPWIPHLNHLWHIIFPHEPDFWYEYDLQWLGSCDVLLRIPGNSPGADREVAFAERHGIKVVYDVKDI